MPLNGKSHLKIKMGFFFQLRLFAREQKRIYNINEFDGRGVSSESDNQLGRDYLGSKARRIVVRPVITRHGVADRGFVARLFGIQGKYMYIVFFSHQMPHSQNLESFEVEISKGRSDRK